MKAAAVTWGHNSVIQNTNDSGAVRKCHEPPLHAGTRLCTRPTCYTSTWPRKKTRISSEDVKTKRTGQCHTNPHSKLSKTTTTTCSNAVTSNHAAADGWVSTMKHCCHKSFISKGKCTECQSNCSSPIDHHRLDWSKLAAAAAARRAFAWTLAQHHHRLLGPTRASWLQIRSIRETSQYIQWRIYIETMAWDNVRVQ